MGFVQVVSQARQTIDPRSMQKTTWPAAFSLLRADLALVFGFGFERQLSGVLLRLACLIAVVCNSSG